MSFLIVVDSSGNLAPVNVSQITEIQSIKWNDSGERRVRIYLHGNTVTCHEKESMKDIVDTLNRIAGAYKTPLAELVYKQEDRNKA